MVNDKILINGLDLYSNFGVKNAVAFRNTFSHPWFYDTDRHHVMEEFSEEFVHLRLLKTGVILQFRYGIALPFRRSGILITSTNEDSLCLIGTKKPSISRTMHRYEVSGRERPSNTALNGIVKFGGYVRENYAKLMKTLREADTYITDESLELICKSLERRKKLYAIK